MLNIGIHTTKKVTVNGGTFILTGDATDLAGVKYVKIPAVNTVKRAEDGSVAFSGALINLKSNVRAYAAISYVEATDANGATEYFYSAYNSTMHARTAEQIADAVRMDSASYIMLSAAQRRLVDTYADGVFEITFTQQEVVAEPNYNNYTQFTAVSELAYLVPGLAEGFVPQGIDVWAEKGLLLISGYFKQYTYTPSSMIFAVDLETGAYVGHFFLKNTNGTYYTGHAGGVAVTPKNLFISNGFNMIRISLSQIEMMLEMPDGKGTLTIEERIPVPVHASFCNYSAGVLWVGDFYHKNVADYATPEWRHLTDPAGNQYGAWTVGYYLDDTESEITAERWSIEDAYYAKPDIVLAIKDRIQGFAVAGDYIVLSRSYGRTNNSQLWFYDNVLGTEPEGTVEFGGLSAPVWYLGVEAAAYTALPMSEGITVYDNALLVLYESGAPAYMEGCTCPTDYVWCVAIPSTKQ